MQSIPHKPDYLSDSEWEFVLDRDRRQCACAEECRQSGQISLCSSELDIDHRHPVELGGDDSVANVRLLCRNVNRGRGLVPDAKWSERNFWDSEMSVSVLREVQRLAGYEAIRELAHRIKDFEVALDARGAPKNFRKQLLGGRITLLAGATGTGKSLLTQSVLFTINKLIGVGRPRVCSTLWLAPDRTLRDAIAQEIEQEAYDLKLVGRAPTVNIATSFADLLRGPMGAAVTVACPQMLWEKEAKRRSDNDKRRALVRFDTIVFDEVDWASGQVRHISDLASHALQFSMTASPPAAVENASMEDRNHLQTFIKRFVLIGNDAIADYERALELDGCLKHFAPVVCAAEHDAHEFIKAGCHGEADTQMPPDHPLYMAAILQAVKDADNEETNMRAIAGTDYFSPHIMVAMPSIGDIKAMKPNLQAQLDRLASHGHLRNPGWGVSAIYGGHERDSAPDEMDLTGKTRAGDWRHPFMVAKNNKGKATDKSKRILLMCQIGDRGINNWPITKFVDNTGGTSIAELIQRDLGRPIRWPMHLSHWVGDECFREFATAKVYIPSSLYTDDKRKAMDTAFDFVRNMRPRIGEAGYLTWIDLLEERCGDKDVGTAIDPIGPPLSQSERYRIQDGIGSALSENGAVTLNDVEPMVNRLFPNYGPRQIQKAVNYGNMLVLSKEFRDSETRASDLISGFTENPVSVMEKLKPQQTYSTEALVRFVKGDPSYNGMWSAYVSRLESDTPDELIVHSVSERLRSLQQETYRAPARTRKLHGTADDPGVLKEVAKELASDLYIAKQAPEYRGDVPRMINRAATILFGLPDAKEGGDMDHPAYHIAILGRYRRDIQRMARGFLISEDKLGKHLSELANLS